MYACASGCGRWVAAREDGANEPAGMCTQCVVCTFSRFHLVASLGRSSTMIKWSEQIKEQKKNKTKRHYSLLKQTKPKRARNSAINATALPTAGESSNNKRKKRERVYWLQYVMNLIKLNIESAPNESERMETKRWRVRGRGRKREQEYEEEGKKRQANNIKWKSMRKEQSRA